MKYGRKDPLLSVIPLDTFPDQFREWWRALQPPERGDLGDKRPAIPIPPDSWSTLQRSGRNGLYLILLGLFWWRHALEAITEAPAKSSAYRDWESTTVDVLWVLSSWAAHSSASPSSPSLQSPTPSNSCRNVISAKSSDKKTEDEGATPTRGRKRKRGTHEESVRGKKRK